MPKKQKEFFMKLFFSFLLILFLFVSIDANAQVQYDRTITGLLQSQFDDPWTFQTCKCGGALNIEIWTQNETNYSWPTEVETITGTVLLNGEVVATLSDPNSDGTAQKYFLSSYSNNVWNYGDHITCRFSQVRSGYTQGPNNSTIHIKITQVQCYNQPADPIKK